MRMHRQCAQFGSGSFAGAAFYGGDYHTSSSQTPVRRSNEFINSDVTPPGSTLISLHQKIDMLLSSNGEQKMAIDELKKENATLKQQLTSVSEDMKKMKETSFSSRPRAKVKLPPVVSVSLSIHPNLITAIMSMMSSLAISVYPEIFVNIYY